MKIRTAYKICAAIVDGREAAYTADQVRRAHARIRRSWASRTREAAAFWRAMAEARCPGWADDLLAG